MERICLVFASLPHVSDGRDEIGKSNRRFFDGPHSSPGLGDGNAFPRVFRGTTACSRFQSSDMEGLATNALGRNSFGTTDPHRLLRGHDGSCQRQECVRLRGDSGLDHRIWRHDVLGALSFRVGPDDRQNGFRERHHDGRAGDLGSATSGQLVRNTITDA